VIPPLHVVTDDEILAREGFVELATGVLEAGGKGVALHLRGPRTSGRALFELAGPLGEKALSSGSTLLVNDRVDLALALDLPGAHLGQRSLPPTLARAILGPQKLLGLSVHGTGEVLPKEEGALSFLIAGTIYSSPSHAGTQPGGVTRVREIREATVLPTLAIGGITPARVEAVMIAGAYGVAVRGGIWDAVDPIAATRGYLKELEKGRGG
jgi:thiamine-phosphate pyrophosphorylase